MKFERRPQYIFLNRIRKKLIVSVFTFSCILLLVNVGAILISNQYNNQKLFISQVEAAVEQIDYQLKVTHVGMEELSENQIIIDFLNKGIDEINFHSDLGNMSKLLKSLESIGVDSKYMGKLWLVNLSYGYVLRNEGLNTTMQIASRPWYGPVMASPDKSMLTKVHEDFFTKEKTMGIVSKVYNHSGEVIGFILMDIYIDDLIASLKERFTVPMVEAYIVERENEVPLANKGSIRKMNELPIGDQIVKEQGKIKIEQECFDGALKLGFSYKDRGAMTDMRIRSIVITIIIFFILFNIIIIGSVRKNIKKLFKPIYKNLDRLEEVLHQDNLQSVNLENKDEFEQLEVLTRGIYDSIKRKIKEKETLIYYDRVTGLPNRYLLENRVEELIEEQRKFDLFFVSIDNFKYFNEFYGYEMGDHILKTFAHTLEEDIGTGGMVARYIGDEFIIIYEIHGDERPVYGKGGYLVEEQFHKKIVVEGIEIHLSFSVGCSRYKQDGSTIEELIKKSHFMCFENKKATGEAKKSTVFFNQEMYNKMIRENLIKNSMKEAFEKEEFQLYFQPISNGSEIVKCEVLMRWISPQYGFVSPEEFIHYAEETGLIITLGDWLIEESFKYYNRIRKESHKVLSVSINISALQLYERDFSKRVYDLANKYNIHKQDIVFEITENILIRRNNVLMDNLEELKQMGFKIALDDFGTGYSSFSYLEKFDLDILKIDKSFIFNKVKEEEYEIVKSLIEVAHVLELEVIVEGVETQEQLEILKKIKCDYFQGYYFAKPLDFEAFKNYIDGY